MKLSDKMTMLDAIKLIKEIAGDDDAMRDDIRASLYNMAGTDDDLSDDSIDTWINAYPEDKREKLRSLFAGPAVEVVKTKIEGGKDQPPEDADDDPELMQILEELANSSSAESDEPAEEPAEDKPAEDESADDKSAEDKADEPAKDEPDTGSEEQDETTRNIIAGLSDK